MSEVISGEFQINPVSKEVKAPEEAKVVVEKGVEVEHPQTAEISQKPEAAEVVDVDTLRDELDKINKKIAGAHTQIRSYQEFAEKHAGNENLLAKLNKESGELQADYDQMLIKRDKLKSQLEQSRKSA